MIPVLAIYRKGNLLIATPYNSISEFQEVVRRAIDEGFEVMFNKDREHKYGLVIVETKGLLDGDIYIKTDTRYHIFMTRYEDMFKFLKYTSDYRIYYAYNFILETNRFEIFKKKYIDKLDNYPLPEKFKIVGAYRNLTVYDGDKLWEKLKLLK